MKPDSRIESVHIEGFRSLAEVTFRPNPGVTVLIGPNGAGKSNLFHFFRMMKAMLSDRRLARFIARNGGADRQLSGGGERTPELKAAVGLSNSRGFHEYAVRLALGSADDLVVAEERLRSGPSEHRADLLWESRGEARSESRIAETVRFGNGGADEAAARCFRAFAEDLGIYRFRDTSDDAAFPDGREVDDGSRLHPDGGNLAPFLLAMKEREGSRYSELCRRIRWLLPVFDDFHLEEQSGRVELRWRARGTGQVMGPRRTSDGSLRFFALVTLFSSDAGLPRVVFLDDPEPGLHPDAVVLVAEMIRTVALDRQVVVATQSPFWVNQFPTEALQVVELDDGRTRLRTPDPDRYRSWIEDGYFAGELWTKNLLGGNP